MAPATRRPETSPEANATADNRNPEHLAGISAVRDFVVSRACRWAATDDAAAKQRRRRRASGPALLGGATGPHRGPLEPVQKLLTRSTSDIGFRHRHRQSIY